MGWMVGCGRLNMILAVVVETYRAVRVRIFSLSLVSECGGPL